jgi:hypothetical protein
MKFNLKFILMIFILSIIPLVAAYDMDIKINSNVADFNTDSYKCTTAHCSTVSFYDAVNSGSKTNIYSLIGSGDNYYAEYNYKQCYIPHIYINHVWGDYTGIETIPILFTKKLSCSGDFESTSISKDTIELGEYVMINSNVESAFKYPVGIPDVTAIPSNIKDEYSSNTQVKFYANNVLINSQEKEILLEDDENFQFKWTPTSTGTYEITVKSTITDCACSSQDTQEKVIGTLIVEECDECEIDSDCEENEGYEYYCDNNDVYEDFFDYSCVDGKCIEEIFTNKFEDCGNSYCENYDYYCAGDDVYKDRICYEKGCDASNCYEDDYYENKFVKNCEDGCYSGECINPLVDLYIDNGRTVPDPVYEDTHFIIKIDTHNTGSYLGNVPVYATIDGNEISWLKSIPFKSGKGDWGIAINGLDKGIHKFVIIIDPENTILEDNENNNEYIFEFNVMTALVCTIDIDCDEDYEEKICQDNDVYLNIFDYSCLDNECILDLTNELNEDCGEDEYGQWGNYCEGDEVWKSRYYANKGCSQGECFIGTVTQKEYVKDCENGCYDGTCYQVCEDDNDCEDDYYSENYCKNDDVYKDLHEFSCTGDECLEEITNKLVEECEEGCVNGKCADNDCPDNDCDDEDDEDDEDYEDDEDCVNGICDDLCLSGVCGESETINLGRYNFNETLDLSPQRDFGENDSKKLSGAFIIWLLLISITIILIIIIILLILKSR